jgi:hypothetical protein
VYGFLYIWRIAILFVYKPNPLQRSLKIGLGYDLEMDQDEKIAERMDALEIELDELRPIAAAAREAYAFLSGRRPGFAPSYAYDVLRAVLEPDKPRKRKSVARRRRDA